MSSLALIAGALICQCASAAPAAEDWVARSNAHATRLLEAQAKFSPEYASAVGLACFDPEAADLGPELDARQRRALEAARAELRTLAAAERDPHVAADLALMLDAIERQLESLTMDAKYLVPWYDAPRMMFGGLQRLRDPQLPAERRAAAAERLARYVGRSGGRPPLVEQAKARFRERRDDDALHGPVRAEVEQAIANAPTYVAGVRKLFDEPDAALGRDLDAFEAQVRDYAEFLRGEVLPRARTRPELPREYYAHRLRQVGVDVDPDTLIQRAMLEYMETRAAMAALAPLVAAKSGIEGRDYREVLRALKREQLPKEKILPYYRGVIDEIDRIIVRERIVDVPKRPMQMRLGSEAESAAQPAPNFRSAPLIGNRGEQGTFVLPLANPAAAGEAAQAYDDFTYEAAAWTLSAHEGRPGHELQSTSLIERGVSLARALFARTSVNTEGWALYAEAEMVPYEPIEGQLVALQFRLMRAARAMLDPLLNLGRIDRERARRVLVDDVVLSEAMARQELDRYQFRSPGQATAYFYGYARILELRMETELALGPAFDRLAYNNFLLDQGTLPPDLLAKAVRERFVPAQRARTPAR